MFLAPYFITVLIFALLIDAIIGDPKWLWRNLSHPVIVFGKCIQLADYYGNRRSLASKTRKINGFIAIFLLCLLAVLVGCILQYICAHLKLVGTFFEVLIVACFLAQKSLYDHVYDVYKQFEQQGVEGGRYAVSMIVGRNTKGLDEAAITRAAIESLAENSSDGVVAPIFFYVLFGLPGLLFYKMVNTADSMIGHKNECYYDFGYGAAKLDDIANFLPARMTAVIALVVIFLQKGVSATKNAFAIMWLDAPQHRSPNGGWPESVYAAFLNIQLSGPRIYDGVKINEPIQNINGREARIDDIKLALSFFKNNMILILLFFVIIYCLLHYSYMVEFFCKR